MTLAGCPSQEMDALAYLEIIEERALAAAMLAIFWALVGIGGWNLALGLYLPSFEAHLP